MSQASLYEQAARILNQYGTTRRCEWSSHNDKLLFTVYNPATGKPITSIVAGDETTVDAAVKVAHEAFSTNWRWKTRQERCSLLLRSAEALEAHRAELQVLLSLENGKPAQDAAFDVTVMILTFRYFGGLADKMASEFFDQGNIYSAVIYEPYGVCAGILPFNWPPVHIGGKVAPCLAAGNVMILKPSEQAPLTALRIIEILSTVLPSGILQIIPGLGPSVPEALIRHPLVHMVSLTGSSATGVRALQAAAPSMTATALELGGKNALVVFEDAEIHQVIKDCIDGAFFNKGESCTAATRIFVHETLYAEATELLGAAVLKLKTGDPLDPSTHVGPVISRERRDAVLCDIQTARDQGARLVAQGALPDVPELAQGYFVAPTLFADVKPESELGTKEIFGPVLSLTSFSTDEEVTRWVNDSAYGLFAGVYSKDFSRAMRIARRLDVGVVLVNNYFRGLLGTPFGGVKASGHGREHWAGTLREWQRIKNIRFPSGLGEIPVWRGAADVTTDDTE